MIDDTNEVIKWLVENNVYTIGKDDAPLILVGDKRSPYRPAEPVVDNDWLGAVEKLIPRFQEFVADLDQLDKEDELDEEE